MWYKVEEREGGTAEKAMLMILGEMRENARAVWSSCSLLRIAEERERERGERVQSRSDAIVVPQHFLSTATVFVCSVSTATANT